MTDKIDYLKTWWESRSRKDQKMVKIISGVCMVVGVVIGAILS